MVAFWRGPMSTAPQTDELPGSSQPIPTPAACARLGYTWPRLFATAAPVAEAELGPEPEPVVVAPEAIDQVWQSVEGRWRPQAGAPMPEYDACFQGF